MANGAPAALIMQDTIRPSNLCTTLLGEDLKSSEIYIQEKKVKVKKQKPIEFKNQCNCLVDYEELEKAIIWYMAAAEHPVHHLKGRKQSPEFVKRRIAASVEGRRLKSIHTENQNG